MSRQLGVCLTVVLAATKRLEHLGLFEVQYGADDQDRGAPEEGSGCRCDNAGETRLCADVPARCEAEEVAAMFALAMLHGQPALCRALYNSNEFIRLN